MSPVPSKKDESPDELSCNKKHMLQWHGEVLAERIAALHEGRTTFIDWKEAKHRLQKRHS